MATMNEPGGDEEPAYDSIPNRGFHRLTVIYTVDDRRTVADQFSIDFASVGRPVTSFLKLDRLAEFYDMAEGQLPRVLERISVPPGELQLTGSRQAVDTARLWLIALPHGAHLVAVTVEVDCSLEDCIPVLEDLHHRRVTIGGKPFWDGCVEHFSETQRQTMRQEVLGPDTYQLAYVRGLDHARLAGDGGRSLVSSLIYRFAGDYGHETLRVAYPQETNRRGAVAATGPYVGVMSGLQGYVENGIFISALQFAGSVSLLREIRLEAFGELIRLRRVTADAELDLRTRRSVLAEMARRLGHLRLELSFGVEAFDRVASLIPSLRIIDFHACLFRTGEMDKEASTVSSMLERLEQGLRSELEKVQAEERSNDERRRQVISAGAGLISLVALPLGLVFGFFGMSAKEVDSGASFLSLSTYPGVYLALAALFVVAFLIAVALRTSFWWSDRAARQQMSTYLG